MTDVVGGMAGHTHAEDAAAHEPWSSIPLIFLVVPCVGFFLYHLAARQVYGNVGGIRGGHKYCNCRCKDSLFNCGIFRWLRCIDQVLLCLCKCGCTCSRFLKFIRQVIACDTKLMSCCGCKTSGCGVFRWLKFVGCILNCWLPSHLLNLVDRGNNRACERPPITAAPSKLFIHVSFWLYLASGVLYGVFRVALPDSHVIQVVVTICFASMTLLFLYVRALVGAYASERAGVSKNTFTSVGSFASWMFCLGCCWHEAIVQTFEGSQGDTEIEVKMVGQPSGVDY